MTKEQENQLIGSLYRQVSYAKLMHIENEFFLKFPVNSGIKNTLKRMKDSYASNLEQIKRYMPETNRQFEKHIEASEEKLNAIANIVEKLYVLEEVDVLRLEEDFNSLIKVQY
jgi:hypothetical protein